MTPMTPMTPMYKVFRIDTESQPRRRLLSAASALPTMWVQEYYQGVRIGGGPLWGTQFYCFEKFEDADCFAFSAFIDRQTYQYELWEVEVGGQMRKPQCMAALSFINEGPLALPDTSEMLRMFWEKYAGSEWPDEYKAFFTRPPEGTWVVERIKPLRRIYRVYRPKSPFYPNTSTSF